MFLGVINKLLLDSNIDTLAPDVFFPFCSQTKLSHKVATTIATDQERKVRKPEEEGAVS